MQQQNQSFEVCLARPVAKCQVDESALLLSLHVVIFMPARKTSVIVGLHHFGTFA